MTTTPADAMADAVRSNVDAYCDTYVNAEAILAALERAGYVLLPVAPKRIADMGDADWPPVRERGDVVG